MSVDLEQIRQRAEAVVAARQEFKDATAHMRYSVAETSAQRQRRYSAGASANVAWLEFCDNAIEDIPALLATIDELTAQRDILQTVVEAARRRRAKGAPDHPIWAEFDAAVRLLQRSRTSKKEASSRAPTVSELWSKQPNLAEIKARAEYALNHLEGQGLSLTSAALILGTDIPALLAHMSALTARNAKLEAVAEAAERAVAALEELT